MIIKTANIPALVDLVTLSYTFVQKMGLPMYLRDHRDEMTWRTQHYDHTNSHKKRVTVELKGMVVFQFSYLSEESNVE